MPYLDPLKTALRCLMHPTSIIAVALLLANDHILKYACPSFLTGKLSDIAGIFFFPFLLASLLALLVAPAGYAKSRSTGAVAFFVTGIWFAAAKATVAGNAVMVEIVSALRGERVGIMLDPTDLLALLALFPAWWLWRREEKRQEQPLEFRVAFPVVVLASLAAMASPPTRHYTDPGFTELIVVDGTLYAMVGMRHEAYTTTDRGTTWIAVDRASAPVEMGDSLQALLLRLNGELQQVMQPYGGYVMEHSNISMRNRALKDSTGYVSRSQQLLEKKLADSAAFYGRLRDSISREINHIQAMYDGIDGGYTPPGQEYTIVVRDPTKSPRLYRSVRKSTRIERSDDNGATWSVDWEIPEERYTYMRRQFQKNTWRQFGVNDMEFIPDGSGTLMATVGSLGIFVRNPEGEWTQHSVEKVDPLVPSARNFNESISAIYLLEWMAVLVLGILAGIILNGAAWRIIPRSDNRAIEQRRPRTLRRIIWLIVAIALGWFGNILSQVLLGPLFHIMYLIPITLVFLIMIFSDLSSLRGIAGKGPLFNAAGSGLFAAFFLPTLCLMFWTLAIPESYEAMIICALVGWAAVVAGGMVMIGKTRKDS